ncbi:hypothetical protein T05_4717 [Trichinella murrelli]|uniref:Uncharacterized protein n=1 Tax=Trichinella murrelli TaxID=144512 RepID=A0A0V0UGJ7_9BILA|nr:hypothetical protein T05_4717 [Trichinella murrelli]
MEKSNTLVLRFHVADDDMASCVFWRHKRFVLPDILQYVVAYKKDKIFNDNNACQAVHTCLLASVTKHLALSSLRLAFESSLAFNFFSEFCKRTFDVFNETSDFLIF